MKILHYSLGFPPYSRGGLTKYAIDLMEEQVRQGHWAGLLWPGEISDYGNPQIKERKDIKGIKSYELKNPEYLPQIYGIKDFEKFQIKTDKKIYIDFLKKINPDVIHIHTLMGMHIAFLDAAQELGIKTVYTTHDFFGICPKSTLYFNGKSCEWNKECSGCSVCCENALGIRKMQILQSRIYRNLKNTKIVEKIRKSQKEKVFALEDVYRNADENDKLISKKYQMLRSGYMEYFDRITTIHFNSSYMKEVFSHYMDVNKGIVCNITHKEIKENFYKYNKKLEKGHLAITYMGPIAEYKGYFTLKKALDKLYAEGRKEFTLTIYHEIENPESYMNVKPPYKYEYLDKVMNNADLIVVPHDVSYGFIVLEALSYGVPVLVTKEVGAKDLIEPGKTGIVCDYSSDSIYEEIKKLLDNPNDIEVMKASVKKEFRVNTIDKHTRELIDKIYI